jgi:hypothetical protein
MFMKNPELNDGMANVAAHGIRLHIWQQSSMD